MSRLGMEDSQEKKGWLLLATMIRVRTGHGKPGKSWNLSFSVSRPGKSWNFIVGHGKVMENYSVCGT